MVTDIFRRESTGLRHQLVLVLRDVDKLTYAEIGRRLGVTQERARQIYFRATRVLRTERKRDAPYIVAALTSMLKKRKKKKT